MGNKMTFSGLLQIALKRAGKHETLAAALDLSPSGLSRRINGETGWMQGEIDRLFEYADCEVASSAETAMKIRTLKEALRIALCED